MIIFRKLLELLDKGTTGIYNFASVIVNVAPVGAFIAELSSSTSLVVMSVKIQFLDQVKVKDTSQLINGISKML